MTKILINDDTLKKMDINEKSILILKMPHGVSAEDVKIAMDDNFSKMVDLLSPEKKHQPKGKERKQ